jgi:hypothetical protein
MVTSRQNRVVYSIFYGDKSCHVIEPVEFKGLFNIVQICEIYEAVRYIPSAGNFTKENFREFRIITGVAIPGIIVKVKVTNFLLML